MTSRIRERSAYRPFAVEVARVCRLTGHFVRITFSGSDLDECGKVLLDQRIKLIFADTTQIQRLGDLLDDGFEWYAWWSALPEPDRPPMRTYTIRAVRPARHEVDIDFVVHGDTGPASRFALSAAPGDRLILVGPDRRVPAAAEQGLAWHPGTAGEVLLAGDETAVPALSNIVETLDRGMRGRAFLEVPTAEDVLDLTTRSAVEITWLVRGERPHGAALHGAVSAWVADRGRPATPHLDVSEPVLAAGLIWEEAAPRREAAGPDDDLFVWLAGESGAITRLRRHLVNEAGLDKGSMAFMGYWKQGRAAAG